MPKSVAPQLIPDGNPKERNLPYPFRTVPLPDRRVGWKTMAIASNPKVAMTRNLALARFASETSKSPKWPNSTVFVFTEMTAIKTLMDHQAKHGGRPLGAADFKELAPL